MTEKKHPSPEVENIIRDAKNLYGSLLAGIKKLIDNYKKAADDKAAADKASVQEKPADSTVSAPVAEKKSDSVVADENAAAKKDPESKQ